MTVLELIKAAMRVIGATSPMQEPTAEESTDAREALNLILGEWQNDNLLALKQLQAFNVVASTKSYTIGTGMTWNGSTPLKVLSAYLTSDSVDYPVDIIGEVEYMEIYDKSLEGRPFKLFYLPSGTTGTVYLWYQPDSSYTLTMLIQKVFTTYTSLSTTIALPNGYLSALKYALAVEIAPEYKIDPSVMQLVIKRAGETLAAIKKTNLVKVAPMQFDRVFSTNNNYNILSDTFE